MIEINDMKKVDMYHSTIDLLKIIVAKNIELCKIRKSFT